MTGLGKTVAIMFAVMLLAATQQASAFYLPGGAFGGLGRWGTGIMHQYLPGGFGQFVRGHGDANQTTDITRQEAAAACAISGSWSELDTLSNTYTALAANLTPMTGRLADDNNTVNSFGSGTPLENFTAFKRTTLGPDLQNASRLFALGMRKIRADDYNAVISVNFSQLDAQLANIRQTQAACTGAALNRTGGAGRIAGRQGSFGMMVPKRGRAFGRGWD